MTGVLSSGPELSLFLSAMPYTGFIFCMINPYMWSVFTLSALLGIGGGVLWTASGEVYSSVRPFVCVCGYICLSVFVCLSVSFFCKLCYKIYPLEATKNNLLKSQNFSEALAAQVSYAKNQTTQPIIS